MAQGFAVGAFSPALGTHPAGHYVVATDVAIGATGGADNLVSVQSNSQGATTAVVDFGYLGSIYVKDNKGAGVQFYDTGADWTTGAYKTLTIDINASANTIKYYYNGALIYTGVVWGGTSAEQVILYSDNYNVSDVADFDNLSITRASARRPRSGQRHS